MPSNTNLLQGTLDVLILKVLTLEPLHGLGISSRIAQVTGGTFQVKPGSLFPALHRKRDGSPRSGAIARINGAPSFTG
jgi:PadR family transcriptional regulator PadR